MLSFRTLLYHQWLEFRRSTFWQKSLAINILISILVIYLAINLVAVGWFLDVLLLEFFPGQDIVIKFTELLCYYFLLDLLARFVLQEIPVLTITPYLHLFIRRQKLLDYLLFRSLFSLFNFLPLLLIIPFFIKVILIQFEGSVITWLAGILCLILVNNFITVFLKKIFGIKPLISLMILLLIGFSAYMDSSGYVPISGYFAKSYFVMVSNPALLVIPVLMAAASYYIDRKLLSNLIYAESQSRSRQRYLLTDSFSFLNKLGITGALVMLEIRLIFRNARPRTLAIMSALFVFYGFIFYRTGDEMGYGFLIFPAFFLTGLFMYSHGQLAMSWNSSHFDYLLVQNLGSMDILLSKYRFFLGMNTIFFLITLPYGLYQDVIYFINTCMYLFNSGVTVYILLFVAVYSTKSVDLTKGAYFNYEGFSGMTYLIILPALGLPFLIYWPFSFLGYPLLGIGFMGLLGITGIFINKNIVRGLARIMDTRKYRMASGFRNN